MAYTSHTVLAKVLGRTLPIGHFPDSRWAIDMATSAGVSLLVGVDLQPISEVEQSLNDFGDHYCRRLFTDHELDSYAPVTPTRLAERFAAKEAVLKVLQTSESLNAWHSIEVISRPDNAIEILLNGSAHESAVRLGLSSFRVSLSHGGGVASAVVTAESTRTSKV
jgi:holo-[acyl-carrier protein] synthase